MLAVPEPHPSQREGDSLTQTRAFTDAHKLHIRTSNCKKMQNKFLLKCQVAIGCVVFLQCFTGFDCSQSEMSNLVLCFGCLAMTTTGADTAPIPDER